MFNHFHNSHVFATATSIKLNARTQSGLNARLIYTLDGTLNGSLRAAVFSQNAGLHLTTC
jgi:hypothetical protein